MHFLYQVNKLTKKVYNNRMNSIRLKCKMHTTFVYSESRKTSDPHWILLNLSESKIFPIEKQMRGKGI